MHLLFWTALALCLLVSLFLLLRVWRRRRHIPVILKAHRLHHADPPRARSALRAYREAARQGYTQAYLPMATLMEHGLPQGPEPLEPDVLEAQELYMQAALLGDARERALARERIGPIAAGPLIVIRARLAETRPPDPPRRLVQLEPVQIVDRQVVATVPSDSQNVHDSVLVRHLRESIAKLPVPTQGDVAALRELRQYLVENKEHGAITTLDQVESNIVPLSALNLTESEVLGRVWQATTVDHDAEQTGLRRDMLVKRMQEISEEGSCASGRVARVVDALSVFDERVALKPAWAIRRELLDKASVVAKTHTGPEPLKDRLRTVFTDEYVKTGLVSEAVLRAELNEWGDHVG